MRLAVGASPGDITWLFVREGVILILIGVSGGLAGALAGGLWLAALLFGVTPADPATFAVVVFTLGLTAACATYVPARRAARLDPVKALNADS